MIVSAIRLLILLKHQKSNKTMQKFKRLMPNTRSAICVFVDKPVVEKNIQNEMQ